MYKNILISIALLAVGVILYYVSLKPYLEYQDIKTLYDEENYEELITADYEKQNSEYFHNLGNAYYKSYIGSGAENTNLLEEAQSSYQESLDIEINEDTQYNYDFVTKLLEEISSQEKEEEQEEGEEGESEDSQGSEQEDNQEQSEDSEGGSQEPSQGPGSEQEKQKEELTQEEQEFLEQRIEQLKNEQRRNQQYFGQQEKQNNFNDLFEQFFGTVDRGGEKNW